MRRDVVTQIIVEYPSGCENFATRLEAERFINANLEEEEPVAVWVEEVNGKKKYDLHLRKKTEKSTLWINAQTEAQEKTPDRRRFFLGDLKFSIPDSSFGQTSGANRQCSLPDRTEPAAP